MGWCGRALALDATLEVIQYAHAAWKVRDGFVKGQVLSLAQTPDGYLWIGTELGLSRFDGVRAVPWQPPGATPLPSESIVVLRATENGTLWIGTQRGLASWNGNALRVHPQFAGDYVAAILEDRQSTVWVGGWHPTGTGFLCTIRGAETNCQGGDEKFGVGIVSLYEDSGGALWVATPNEVWRWRPGPPKLFPLAASISTIAQTLTEFRGKILVATADGVQQIDGEHVQPFLAPRNRLQVPLVLFRDRDGALWIGTQGAGLLHALDRGVDAFAPVNGLSGNTVNRIFEDREGSIWVATENGIDRFRAVAVVPYASLQGYPAAVLGDRTGSVWIATQSGLYEWREGRFALYRGGMVSAKTNDSSLSMRQSTYERVIAGMPDVAKASLFEDREHRIWIGSQSGVGYLDHDHYVPVPGLGDGYIDSIAEDSAGNVWIAHRKAGLLRWSGGRALERFAWPFKSSGNWAYRLAADPVRGGVWMGSYSGGVVAHVVDGKVDAKYSTKEGVGKGSVSDVQTVSDGTVWVATEGGLTRIKDGGVATLNTGAGLPCDVVHWFITDDDGAIWMHMPCGLVRIAHSDLNAWTVAIDQGRRPGPVPSVLFDNSDGFVADTSGGSFTPHVTKSADGKLWFLMSGVVGVVDPRHLPHNEVPPPVQIEQIVVDRKAYAFSTPLSLPPLVRDLQIDYTALSLVAPEKVLFRYKLEGRDQDWSDAGTRRRAFYTDLPPGDYRFRVIACNNSGVWNEQGASLDFSIAPAYWQTNGFRALVVIALIALAYAIFRLRVAQMARHFNATLDARVNERTRIARDLHDTLLQSFHGLLLRFQTARSLLPANPAKAADVLDSAIDQAAGAITEGRDAVQGLRTSATEMNDLAESIRALAEELATANGNSVVLRVDVQGASRPLHPIVRDEVFRIASEALRNAFKHAGADQIEVEMHYDERQMRLRVRDDGKGIAPELLRAEGREGHFGLHGMRERAKLAGGKLVIWSGPDAGTEVELSIPASHAYSKASRPRSWLAEKVMGQGDSSDS